MPALADVCLVGAVEPETLVFQEPIVAATEPEQRALVLEIRRRYPPTVQDEYGSGKVLRAEQADLRNDIDEAVLEQIAYNADHLRLLQQLGIKAWLIVPMMISDRKVGTIVLLQTKTHYGFDRADLDVVEELARRTAVALDNVRLYQQAQQANQSKDEFLAIVSHKLRNPLNSILDWAQLLQKGKVEAATVSRAHEIILRNARLQNKLIEDLLDVSRIIQNQLEISHQSSMLSFSTPKDEKGVGCGV